MMKPIDLDIAGPGSAVGSMSDCRSSLLTYLVEIDHEIISTAILLPSDDLRKAVVSYKQNNVHEVLVSGLFKLAQENNG